MKFSERKKSRNVSIEKFNPTTKKKAHPPRNQASDTNDAAAKIKKKENSLRDAKYI